MTGVAFRKTDIGLQQTEEAASVVVDLGFGAGKMSGQSTVLGSPCGENGFSFVAFGDRNGGLRRFRGRLAKRGVAEVPRDREGGAQDSAFAAEADEELAPERFCLLSIGKARPTAASAKVVSSPPASAEFRRERAETDQ